MNGRPVMILKDPMLQAAAEGIATPDHLRWLTYADDELARLRDRLDLPTPTGYSSGEPIYETATSATARRIRREVEGRMQGAHTATTYYDGLPIPGRAHSSALEGRHEQ